MTQFIEDDIIKNFIENTEVLELYQHLIVLILRKSTKKLNEYISMFDNKSDAIKTIIELKYQLAKCRPELINILVIMSKNPKRFQFDNDIIAKLRLIDTENNTEFVIYNFSSRNIYGLTSKSIINPNIHTYINGQQFLSKHEELLFYNVVHSLKIMSLNEYKLQEELKMLEEQKNVFETYKNEKLSSR